MPLTVFYVPPQLLFPRLGLLSRLGLEFENSILDAHDFDPELLRLIRDGFNTVREVVEIENTLRCLHILRIVTLEIPEFSIF